VRARGSPEGYSRLSAPGVLIGSAVHARGPGPPRGFRGGFSSAADARDDFSVVAGPLRLRPAAVARPADIDDLIGLVEWAGSEGQTLIPRGAGTGMPGGNVGAGVIVDLTDWSQMSAVDSERRSVRVQPGVVADRLQDRAAGLGLFLPSMPSSSDRCTLGGMVANNAAGARSFRYGAMREWVDSLEVVTASGALVRAGRDRPAPDGLTNLRENLVRDLGSAPAWPPVRKNSSGYALDRFLPAGDPASLFVGSEGTLGFVTSIDLRLAPVPSCRALLLVAIADIDALVEGVRAADAVGAAACEFFGRRYIEIAELESDPRAAGLCRGAEALLLVELDGASEEEAFGRLHELSRRAASFGIGRLEVKDEAGRAELWRIRHAASPRIAAQAEHGLVSMQFIEDSVVPPRRLGDYLRGLDRILASEETDAAVFGHAGDGNVHVNPLIDVGRTDWRERVRRILDHTVDLVAGLGGTLSGEHGDGRIRGAFHDRVWGSELSGAFREVKSSLDPLGILNPGVIVPLEGQDPLEGLSPLGGRR